MPIAPGPSSGPSPENLNESTGAETSPDNWWSAEEGASESAATKSKKRFSATQLALTGVASLVVGAVVTALGFTAFDGDDDTKTASGRTSSREADEEPDVPSAPVSDDEETEEDQGDVVIGVGEGFSLTTYDGDEIEVFVHDFSVDQACKYGQSLSQPEKSPDTRIVQLTIDVANHGDDSYYMDGLETLTTEGYSQPVEGAYLWCDYSDDGANRWSGAEIIEKGDKRLFYGAFEVQPDAAQLVLSTASNGKMLMDIPARGGDSGSDGDGPNPTSSATAG
ncbi:MAG TPA: hypothetical protein H9870_07870 [Candidatus Corynebacterium avicola]|uniref:DUF4352 domain-containing protein n=1 Tax=Candidatus Corynebacterium avicola TaxID=2838527 RepID=A0A9D1UM34_9CORY|nr:hypothetical protein [Candidatus Corynebacterium avicola]